MNLDQAAQKAILQKIYQNQPLSPDEKRLSGKIPLEVMTQVTEQRDAAGIKPQPAPMQQAPAPMQQAPKPTSPAPTATPVQQAPKPPQNSGTLQVPEKNPGWLLGGIPKGGQPKGYAGGVTGSLDSAVSNMNAQSAARAQAKAPTDAPITYTKPFVASEPKNKSYEPAITGTGSSKIAPTQQRFGVPKQESNSLKNLPENIKKLLLKGNQITKAEMALLQSFMAEQSASKQATDLTKPPEIKAPSGHKVEDIYGAKVYPDTVFKEKMPGQQDYEREVKPGLNAAPSNEVVTNLIQGNLLKGEKDKETAAKAIEENEALNVKAAEADASQAKTTNVPIDEFTGTEATGITGSPNQEAVQDQIDFINEMLSKKKKEPSPSPKPAVTPVPAPVPPVLAPISVGPNRDTDKDVVGVDKREIIDKSGWDKLQKGQSTITPEQIGENIPEKIKKKLTSEDWWDIMDALGVGMSAATGNIRKTRKQQQQEANIQKDITRNQIELETKKQQTIDKSNVKNQIDVAEGQYKAQADNEIRSRGGTMSVVEKALIEAKYQKEFENARDLIDPKTAAEAKLIDKKRDAAIAEYLGTMGKTKLLADKEIMQYATDQLLQSLPLHSQYDIATAIGKAKGINPYVIMQQWSGAAAKAAGNIGETWGSRPFTRAGPGAEAPDNNWNN